MPIDTQRSRGISRNPDGLEVCHAIGQSRRRRSCGVDPCSDWTFWLHESGAEPATRRSDSFSHRDDVADAVPKTEAETVEEHDTDTEAQHVVDTDAHAHGNSNCGAHTDTYSYADSVAVANDVTDTDTVSDPVRACRVGHAYRIRRHSG
jgi:hypothetical protein